MLDSLPSQSSTKMTPTLVDDVLDDIFQHCAASTLALVSQVSSGLHALALPHLLRRVVLPRLFRRIHLGHARQAHLFLEFILRYPPSSPTFPQGLAHHIFELPLDVFVFRSEGDRDYPCSQLAPMFACAIRRMSNLRLLDIKANTEQAMKYSPELATAFLGLQSLKSLTLHEVGKPASEALGQATRDTDGVTEVQNLEMTSRYQHGMVQQHSRLFLIISSRTSVRAWSKSRSASST